ncbi:sodium/proline symporter [Natronorubrum daqingense]|uniref:Sodium/proline symporter/sodium/pantothenate symporter n=1 Tax=Natronorubrum daqingense TaxID=588898 RepID=A0A1N7DXM3_9EURY|nr:sodium/proline symporter [Natronorubrum daqingense]APX96238.1 sodium:solute symporter [Natronorubrum daqingense]SIR80609.1 sodium/proline symporter/sodium/pantothenate symporter [Natronorubrum daqingense]
MKSPLALTPLPLQEEGIPIADDPVIIAFGAAYLLIVLAIGVWGWMQTDSTKDFLITGKSIGTWVLALTAFSVIQSGFGFVGGPELVYEFGTTALWIFFTAPLGFLVTWIVLGKRMRLLADIRNVLTLPDAMYVRYESEWVRGLSGVAVALGVVAYLAVNLAALQFVMRAIFGIPVIWGLLGGAVILLLYSMLGGMIAGVWTDFLQAITMIVGAGFVFAYALSFGGGMENISQNLASTDPALVSPFGAMGGAETAVLVAIAWWVLFSVGAAGQPHLITKFYMSRDMTILKWGAPIAAISYAISSLIAFSAGLSMRAMVEAGEVDTFFSASEVGPVFVLEYTPSVVAGLILAALLAAIMSTSDSFLNIGAAAISRDIPRSLGRPITDSKTELRVTQVALAGLTVLSTVVVYFSDALVGILGAISWGFFAAAFVPIVVLGLNWKGASKWGAIAALVVGMLFNVVYNVIPEAADIIGGGFIVWLNENVVMATYPFPPEVPAEAISLLVAMPVFIFVSILAQQFTEPERQLPDDLHALFER